MKLSKSTLGPLSGALGLILSSLSPAEAIERAWIVDPLGTGEFTDGANWNPNFTSWATGDSAFISNGGTATLANGAVDLGSTGSVFVGNGNTGTGAGTLNITDSSLTTGKFKAGVVAGGNGTATVSGSGTIVTVSGQAGAGLAGTGKITLTNGALWNQSGVFIVGGDNFTNNEVTGTGTLEVLSGAAFTSNANLAIGRNKGTGTVLVNGGAINTSGEINLGAYVGGTAYQGGTGTFTISAGSVTASRINVHSGAGTLNFNGGTVTAKAITRVTASTGAAHFNGTTFVAGETNANFFGGFATTDLDIQSGGLRFNTNGNNVTFAPGLSGVGRLTKTGSGTLTLAGVGTHAGGTLVEGGTLVISPGAVPGTGDITVATGGSLDVDYSLTLAGGLVLEDGSTMILDQNLTFASLQIDGNSYAAGTYDYDALKASYGDIFADGGSGSITVVPEPSALVLSMLGLLGTLAWLRFRRQSHPA